MLYTGDTRLSDNKQFQDYKHWLVQSKPNQQFVYFTGNALTESIIGATIGKVLMEDAYQGFVYLVQKRVAPYIYNYIAVKAPPVPCHKLIPSRAPSREQLRRKHNGPENE